MKVLRYLRATLGCVPALLPGERSMLGLSVFFLAASLLFGVLLGTLSTWARTHLPDTDAPAASPLGIGVASWLVRAWEERGDQNQPRLPLSGAQVAVMSSDPAQRKVGEDLVRFAGGTPSSPLAAHIQIQWDGQEQEWLVSSLRAEAPELAVLGWFGLRRASTPFQLSSVSAEKTPAKASVVFVGTAPPTRDGRFFRMMSATLVYLCVVLPALGLLFFSAGVLSFELDRERAAGSLESFALAPLPLSSLFLARALVRSATPTLGLLSMICIAGVFAGFPHPLVVLMLLVAMFASATALGLVGQVQVVWFHHRYSRFVGQVLFNPAMLLMLSIFAFGGHMVQWLHGAVSSHGVPGSSLPILEWTVPQAASLLAAVLPAAAVLGGFACLVIDWRLGARRQGLSRVV